MPVLKKLLFAPFFLIAFYILISLLSSLLGSYDFIFSLSTDTLLQLMRVAALLTSAGLLFALFAVLANDLKIILPVILLAAASPVFFLKTNLSVFLIAGVLVTLFLTSFVLQNALKSYLTFQPSSLIGPSVKRFAFLLIVIFSLVYFLSLNRTIGKEGFEIPDSLVDAALKMAPVSLEQNSASPVQLPQISTEQINMLKKNPQLLKQYGLDPEILDTLSGQSFSPQQTQNALLKQTLRDQIQNIIEPYQNFIPALLALILFLTLQSLTSVMNLLVYPLLWLIFLILEKTGFVKFEIEQRPVKKILV